MADRTGIMTFLTDFADQAVVLPVVASVALVLAMGGWGRAALLWLGAVGLTFGVVLGLKLGFLACGPVFGPWSIHSPSGHTAAAAMVAGGLAVLLAARRASVWPVAAAVAALAGGLIGFSRVTLGFHSVPEVLLGGFIGTVGAVLFARHAQSGMGARAFRRPVPLLVIPLLVALLLHGMRLPAEAAIWQVSLGALDFVPACRTGGAGVL